jgi:hypothetical protein
VTEPKDGQLFAVPAPPGLPEQLLVLASAFVRHADLFADHALDCPTSEEQLSAAVTSSDRLAVQSRDLALTVLRQLPPYRVEVHETVARLRQLSRLAESVTSQLHLIQGIFTNRSTNLPEGAPPSLPDQTGKTVRLLIKIARDLTALAPGDLLDGAEALAREIQRRDFSSGPAPDGYRLTAPQYGALHSVARGHVALAQSFGKWHVNSRTSLSLSTIRSLEKQGLLEATPIPAAYLGFDAESRVHLTSAGRAHLAAGLALLTAPSPRTSLPAKPFPAPAAGRQR